jgi:hypothetical protein
MLVDRDELIKKATIEVLSSLIYQLEQETENFKTHRTKLLKTAQAIYKKIFPEKDHYLISYAALDEDVFTLTDKQHERTIVGKLISKMFKDRGMLAGKPSDNMKIYRETRRQTKYAKTKR